MDVMQGDAYSVAFAIASEDGEVTAEQVLDVEIIIGDMRKTYAAGEVSYDAENRCFVFPLSQEETLHLPNAPLTCQVRCKFMSGDVIGTDLGKIDVKRSASKVVL